MSANGDHSLAINEKNRGHTWRQVSPAKTLGRYSGTNLAGGIFCARDLRQRVVGTRRCSSSNQLCTRMSLSSTSSGLWLTDLLPRLRIAG
jgi:hypothetical protein